MLHLILGKQGHGQVQACGYAKVFVRQQGELQSEWKSVVSYSLNERVSMRLSVEKK